MVNVSEAISFRLRCRLLRQVSGDIGTRFYDENRCVKAMQPPIFPAARAYPFPYWRVRATSGLYAVGPRGGFPTQTPGL